MILVFKKIVNILNFSEYMLKGELKYFKYLVISSYFKDKVFFSVFGLINLYKPLLAFF